MVPITNQLLRIIIIRITNQLLRIIIIIIRITNQLLRIIIILVPRRCPHLMHRIVLCRYLSLPAGEQSNSKNRTAAPNPIANNHHHAERSLRDSEAGRPVLGTNTTSSEVANDALPNPATNNVSPPNPNNANYHNHAANGYKTGMPRYVILQAI